MSLGAETKVEPLNPIITEQLLKQRGSMYGDIRDNTLLQHKLKEHFRAWYFHNKRLGLSNEDASTHYECLEYVIEKLARIATGVGINEDNYNDIKGYAELARKIAMGENTDVSRDKT